MSREVVFPDGTTVRAAGLPDRELNAGWREFGLYADEGWKPTWPAERIPWPDYRLPERPREAASRSGMPSIEPEPEHMWRSAAQAE